MKSSIVEKNKKYIKYGNKIGFVSLELVDNKLIFDSFRGLDVDLTMGQMKLIAKTLLSFAEMATPYFHGAIKDPVSDDLSVGQKFIAFNIATGLEFVSGGICTVTYIKKIGRRSEVLAIDEKGTERIFGTSVWKLEAL